ncbi:hypothetical protein ACFX2H_013802 [Malus domestica]|nr:pentatricopeptide repeat-containing protein At4g26800-like [Malus domestica]
MIKTGYETDIIVHGVLLNGLCKNGLMIDALKFFFQAVYGGVKPNVCTFNMLIDGCCRLKQLSDAVKVYIQMGIYNIKPDLVMYTVLIKEDAAQEVFEQLAESGPEPDIVTFNTVICGKMEDAMLMINTMLEKGPEPNVVAYSCLIDGYFKSENTKGALELLEEMLKSVSPNIVS